MRSHSGRVRESGAAVCSACEQMLDHVNLAGLGRQVQRSEAAVVSGVDIHAGDYVPVAFTAANSVGVRGGS